MKHIGTTQTGGTFLVGRITATRENIEKVFGTPWSYPEGEKVTTEWGIRFEDGTTATIYDWKRAIGAPQLKEAYAWHIGGTSARSFELIEEALAPKKNLEVESVQVCTLCGDEYEVTQGDLVIRFGQYFEFTCYKCQEEKKNARKYTLTATFSSDRALTSNECANISSAVQLQLLEPWDENNEEETFRTSAISVSVKERN